MDEVYRSYIRDRDFLVSDIDDIEKSIEIC